MKGIRRWLGCLLAVILAFSALHFSAAEATETAGFMNETANYEEAQESFRTPGMENAREEGLSHPLTEDELRGNDTRVLRKDNIIYMIQNPAGLAPLTTPEEAAKAAFSLCHLLGAEKDLHLELYACLNALGTRIYAFYQVRDEAPVYGRALKLVTDGAGRITALFSSLGFPEETEESLGLSEDPMSLALANAKYPAVPDFESMIQETWTGTVAAPDGVNRELTVPVMRHPETGLYYLGDAGRKIVVGDFSAMVYDGRKECLLTREENAGWQEDDLLMYDRLLQCWDYYAAMGWRGPDGIGSPTLLLNNLRTIDGESMENAAYLGPLDQWQTFVYSSGSGFGKCLDVVAHEYTHCITETSVGISLYKDDEGAINESLSDIMGNLCELTLKQTQDTTWQIGENMGSGIRSMTDPHAHNQPEYVWDEFYAPSALQPNDINDRGGVHFNSSILSRIAARLCLEEGMSSEEAARFWMTVDLGLLTRTDFSQMSSLLDWALSVSGCEAWREALSRLTEEARLSRTELPEALPEGQKLVTLSLPDTEALQDANWMLQAIQFRTDKVGELLGQLMDELLSDEAEDGEGSGNGLLSQLEALFSDNPANEVTSPLTNQLEQLVATHSTWISESGKPMTLITDSSLPTLYFLVNLDPSTADVLGCAVLLNGEWFNIGALGNEDDLSDSLDQLMPGLTSLLLSFLIPGEATTAEALPSAGLENLTL